MQLLCTCWPACVCVFKGNWAIGDNRVPYFFHRGNVIGKKRRILISSGGGLMFHFGADSTFRGNLAWRLAVGLTPLSVYRLRGRNTWRCQSNLWLRYLIKTVWTCHTLLFCVFKTLKGQRWSIGAFCLRRELVLLCPSMLFTLGAAREMWPIHKFSSLRA